MGYSIPRSLRRNADVLSLNSRELEGSIFNNTRHGLCQLCKESLAQHTCGSETEDITIITENQRKVVKKELDQVLSKFSMVFEKAGVQNLLSDD